MYFEFSFGFLLPYSYFYLFFSLFPSSIFRFLLPSLLFISILFTIFLILARPSSFFPFFLLRCRRVGNAWCGAVSDSVIGRASEPCPPGSPSATLVLLWDTNCAIKDITQHCIKRTSHCPAFSVVKGRQHWDIGDYVLLHSRVLEKPRCTTVLVVPEYHTLRYLGSVKDYMLHCFCGCWRPHCTGFRGGKNYTLFLDAQKLWTTLYKDTLKRYVLGYRWHLKKDVRDTILHCIRSTFLLGYGVYYAALYNGRSWI